ncbi:MAG: LON peptidase substrate-binding domain-containing protein [Gemmataceae bacterium]|jgi:Lon protease-like protein|nr:peptidase S16 [bacterium]
MHHHQLFPEDFDCTVSLFPLGDVVLFPRVMQPLHIFEPRYRQMTEDALATDRLIAMALAHPFAAHRFMDFTPIFPVVCIGKIQQEVRLPDGRFNMLLQGLARARITSEFETGKLYRRAQVQILEDIPCCSADKERSLRAKVAKRMGDWFTHQPDAASQLERLVHSDLTLGDLCDIFSFALPLDSFVKMDLLTTLNIEKRASMFLDVIHSIAPAVEKPETTSASKNFPPGFSPN